MPQESYKGKFRKESDLFSLWLVLFELDNFENFDYLEISPI